MKYNKVAVALIIAFNVAFTAAVLWISLQGGTVPDALIVAWFGFTTAELWALAMIKIKDKPKGGMKDDQLEGETDE